MEWCWIDGRLVAGEEAAIGVNDRGFIYGDGLFETIRLRSGRPFLLEAHLERLAAAAARIGLKIRELIPAVRQGLAAVIQANGAAEGVGRIVLSRGRGRGLAPPDELHPTVVVTAAAGGLYAREVYRRGLRAVLLPWPRNERSPLAGLKSLNCGELVLGAAAARQAGVDEGIFLNTTGQLAEGTSSNVFLVKGGAVFTPPVEAGILPGIARARILGAGFGAAEHRLTGEDLYGADEAFLTNSILGVAPLVELNSRPIGSGGPGPVTGSIMEWYEGELNKPE